MIKPRVSDDTDGPNGDGIEVNQKSLEDVYVDATTFVLIRETVY